MISCYETACYYMKQSNFIKAKQYFELCIKCYKSIYNDEAVLRHTEATIANIKCKYVIRFHFSPTIIHVHNVEQPYNFFITIIHRGC